MGRQTNLESGLKRYGFGAKQIYRFRVACEQALLFGRVLARLTSFAQIGELARRLVSCG